MNKKFHKEKTDEYRIEYFYNEDDNEVISKKYKLLEGKKENS